MAVLEGVDGLSSGVSFTKKQAISKKYLDPLTLPKDGVHQSSNARIILSDGVNEYEIIKSSRSVIRWSAGIGLYLENGKNFGTTFTGKFRASGSLMRPYLNRADTRLVIGDIKGSSMNLLELNKTNINSATAPTVGFGTSNSDDVEARYSPRGLFVDFELDSDSLNFDSPVYLRAGMVLFVSNSIQFDANDIIRSPLDFVASYVGFYTSVQP